MDDLRSWWEVPSIAHFCSLFRSAFDLTDFDIEDLEEGFLQSETEDGSAFLLDLLCRLLNGCYGRKDITITNYDLYVKDIIKYKWDASEKPIKEKTEFKSLSLREKVELIYAICEYRLDTDDVIDLLKGFEGDSMRVEPLGKDKNGALYWYFYGNRLYMEDPKPKKELTKEEKRARDREKRIESKRKKQEEKRQRKEERRKLKALRKAEREKKIEESKKAEDSNTRRSGRLRTKKMVIPESESSESSSSSEEEEEIDESADEETEVEETEEKKTGRGRPRKTPAKTPAKKGTASQKTPKKETPVLGTRTSSRKSAKKAPEPKTPQVDTGVRRSARKRKQPEPPPLPSPYNSDTEEDIDYDVDSGHESAGSLRSEASKISTKSSSSKKSSGAAKRSSRRPTANLNLKRDLSQKDEDDEEMEDEKDNNDDLEKGTEKSKDSHEMDIEESKEEGNKEMDLDECKEKEKKEMDEDESECERKASKEMEVDESKEKEVKGTDNNGCKEDDSKGIDKDECRGNENKNETDLENKVVEDADTGKDEQAKECKENVNEAGKEEKDEEKVNDIGEGSKDESTSEDVGTEEKKGEEEKMEVVKDSADAKEVLEIKCEPEEPQENNTEMKDNQEDDKKTDDAEVKAKKDDMEEINASPAEGDENMAGCEIKTEAVSVKDEVTVKTEEKEKVEDEDEEKVETEDDVDKTLDDRDEFKTETSEPIKEEKDVKPDNEDNSNDSNDTGVKRSLRKRNTENVKTETKADNVDKDNDGSDVKEEVKPDAFTLSKPAVEPTPSKSATRWHLVCETLDDWVNLAEWFKESPVRCEKSLSKVIREDFLPVLPEIIEAREKEKQKKLLQEQDLRRSNRLTVKMREKLEQERILAEALAEEEKARIKAEEEKKLKEEQLRLEDENRQREDRRKAREERAKRLSMRGERARLIAEGKEIPAEMIYTGSQKYKDDGDDSDDSRCDLKEEEDYESLMKVINAMKYHKDCWPFLQPVTDEQAPGYSDIIKRPMDLSKIEEKVDRREYRSTQHFLSDFRLMFNNCKRFNGQDSTFSDCARSMENMLKKYMKRFVTEEPTDKYYEDKTFMVPGARGGPRTGEKRYRPQRAASSRALQTVHKALNSDDSESSSDEDDHVPRKKAKDSTASPFRTQSHDKLLLDKMIELKRQRERKLAASALHNHGVITRGPERIRVPNPQGGVMIIPKSEMNPTGVLRMAATREIKRKVNTQLPNLTPPTHRLAKPAGVLNATNQTVVKTDLRSGLSIIDQTTPGSKQPKVIKIVASNANGQPSVKQTAENVRVSSDGYLIISGKNSGIKVTENTKIVIQPPGAASGSTPAQSSSDGGPSQAPVKTPLPAILKQTPSPSSSSTEITLNNAAPGSPSVTYQKVGQITVPGTSTSSASQVLLQQQLNLQGLLKQTATNPQFNQHQALQGLVNQIGSRDSLTPDVKKKLDIAQRILLQHQQKKKLLEQQKAKLDSNPGVSSSSTIEDRLRDPSVNLDQQLGSVSQNVISNVNIASDILDTYYSVLNDAKSKASNESEPSATSSIPNNTQQLNKNQAMPQTGANMVTSQPVSSIQSVSGQTSVSGQSATGGQTTLSEQASQNQALPQSSVPQSVSSVQGVTGQTPSGQTTSSNQILLGAALQNIQSQKQGNMSEVTRQIYDLINKTGTGGLVTALANVQKMKSNASVGSVQVQLPVVSCQDNAASSDVNQALQGINQVPETIGQKQIDVNQVQQMDNQGPQIISQTKIINQAQPVVNQIPQSVNQVLLASNKIPNVVNQTQPILSQVPQSGNHMPQTISNITSSSSISDLLRSAMIKPITQTGSEVSPIEALLARSTPIKTVQGNVLKTVSESPLIQALTSRTPVSKQFETSPEKNERQNLFDSFETNKIGTSAITINSQANEQKLSGHAEKQDLTRENVTKEVKLKLRADGMSLPASSTLNFGSPLKATSVLEALKFKLHTVKPQTEVGLTKNSEGSITTDTNVENVDEYLAPSSNVTDRHADQALLPSTALENALNPTVVSGLSSNVQSQILNPGLNLNDGSTLNALTTEYNQNVSIGGGNKVNSIAVGLATGNLTQNSALLVPDNFSPGNVNISTDAVQGHARPELIPTTVQISSTNLMQQGNTTPTIQTLLEQGTGNIPNIPTLQGTITQAPVQVSSAVLQALKQNSGGVAVDTSTQNALLQQLSSIISNHSPSVQLGAKNVVAMDFKPVNPLNTVPQVVQPVPQVVQPVPQGIQSVPQIIQCVPQGISQTADISGSFSTGNIALTNTRLVVANSDFSGFDNTANLNDLMTSNLTSVNQSDLQSSSFVTETNVEMDTSQNASLLLNETEENQS